MRHANVMQSIELESIKGKFTSASGDQDGFKYVNEDI